MVSSFISIVAKRIRNIKQSFKLGPGGKRIVDNLPEEQLVSVMDVRTPQLTPVRKGRGWIESMTLVS